MGTVMQKILEDRGKRYGEYAFVALISQDIKRSMKKGKAYNRLTPSMKESLDMVANKIARIVNGDPYYSDSWVDIKGYVQLVLDSIPINGITPEEV